jgi:hypothetical protein
VLTNPVRSNFLVGLVAFVRLFLPAYQYVALTAVCHCHGMPSQNRALESGFRGFSLRNIVLNADFQQRINHNGVC